MLRAPARESAIALGRQRQQREHATGAALLGAVGIVMRKITGRAEAAVVHLLYSGGFRLRSNRRREIDFVMRRANARAELHDEILRRNFESLLHLSNRVRNNPQLSSPSTGMHQSDGALFTIGEVHRATIRDVNPETDVALVGEQTVATGKAALAFELRINDRDLAAVDLAGSDENAIRKFRLGARRAMSGVERAQDFGFVIRKRNSWHAADERVRDSQSLKRFETLERQRAICQASSSCRRSCAKCPAGS